MADIFEQALKNAKKKRKNVINLTNLDVKTTKTTKKGGGKNKNGSASKQPKTDYKYSGNKSNGSNVKEKSKSTPENAYKTKTRYGGGKNKNNKIKSQYKDERPTNNLSAIAEKKKKEAKEKEKREAQRAHNKQVQSDRVKRKNAQTSHQKSTNGKKSGLVQGHGSNADKQLAAEKNASKRNDGIKSRQLPAKTREIMTNSKYRNFVAGVGDAVIDNSPVGIAYSVAKGKKLSDSDFMYSDKATKGTKDELVSAQDAGEMAGTAASYLTAYGAAGKATGKAAAKVVGSSAAQKTIGKLAGTKLGKTVGKEFIENTTKSATKDAIADATIGTAMDYGQARGQGLEGSELYKYMGKQALINLGLGAVGEAVPFISTAVRNTRLARQAAELAASNASDAAKAEKKLKLSKQSAKLEEAKKTAKQRQKDARKAKTKANLENTKNTQHNSLELNKYDEAMSTSEKKSSTRKGEGVKFLKNDSGFNSYMAEKYGDIYSIENVAKKNGQTLSKFLTEEYEAYKFMPDDMKLNYEASESVVADVEAKTGVISDSEKREFSIYLQHKYGDFSNAEAAAKKQGMDMQAFFQKEKALYDQAKAAEKNAAADTIEDAVTGETVPNAAKQTGDTTVDPATGEAVPNMAKTADGTMVDPATGETIPNTAKAAQEGAEEAVEGAEKSAADAFEEGDLTPESKKKVYDAVQKRTGVKIVEEEFAGDIANSDGYYKDGVIHINANSKQPKYTVLKHELTHHMQSSKKYDAFSEFIFDNLKRKGFDVDDLRAKKIASYAKSGVDLSMKDADFELVAEYCGEFLFNSQKSIDRLARENYTLATWVLDWIKDTIAKIGKSDDAKFLIDAQRKYEYALRNADVKTDGKQWNLYAKANKYEEQIGDYAENSGKTAEEIKRDHNLHRGFKGDWLSEIDDSKARLNTTELEKAKKGEKVNLRNLLEHKELWRKVGEDFDGYRVTFDRLKNDEAGAEIDYVKKLITISNQSKGKTDSQILSSLLHETQHALQDYYGLPHGANINLWDKILSKNDKAYKDAAKEARKGLDQFQGGVDDLESLNTGIEVGIDFGDIRDLNYKEAWNYLNSFERKAKRRHIFEGEVEEAWNRAEEGLRNADFYSSGNEHLAKLAYHNTAGELEAYDVQSRMGLSKEGRKKNLPRQRNENTRYVEDYGYYPDKSSLYVKATEEEKKKIKTKHLKFSNIDVFDAAGTKRDANIHQGFAGDWLYEVDDSAANWGKKMLELKDNPKRSIPLKDAIDHPELWKRLEETGEAELLDGYKVNVRKLKKGIRGECDSDTKRITLSPDAGFSTLIHEIQHAIQDEQGLPGGSNPHFWADKLSKYDDSYGKIEDNFLELWKQVSAKAQYLDRNRPMELGHSSTFYSELVEAYWDSDYKEMKRIFKKYRSEMKESGFFDTDVLAKQYIQEIGNGIETLKLYERYMGDLAHQAYRNTAGEIEARDAAERLDFTNTERSVTMPARINEKTLYTDDSVESYKRQFERAGLVAHGEENVPFSLGENVIKDPDLKKTSQNLYGEKGNKYLQTASEAKATAKATNTELPKSGTKAENKLPTKNGKKQVAANGKAKSVSADAKNPEAEMTYKQASKRYETYKNGTPKKLPAKGDVSKAADTIIGSDVIGDEMREAIKENVSNYVKVTKTNRTTIDNVAAKIDSDGLENSISNFRDTLAKKNRFNEEDIAMGAEILRRLDDLGDYERALDITDDLVEMMSQAGRTLQAANIFTSMTPYGKLRSIKRAAAKMSERYGKNVEVNEDLMKELFEAKDSAKADKIKQRIFEDLWNQVPSSLMEKLDALRYTAMLSSPKTHIRNILGNVAMYVGKSLSDGVEAGLEKTVFKGKMEKLDANRTKSFLNPLSSSDRELKKKAGEIFESVKEQLMNGSSKYIEKGDVRPQNSRVFKSKTLEAGRKLVSGSLEKEDEWFMKMNFQAAFAKICKANGLEVGELTAKELRQYTAYAAEQAQAATFRDPNALASAMNKVYRWANDTSKSDAVGKLGKGLVKITMDATVPFRRTPANILKQAWRYSPGGVAEGMTRIVAAKDAESLLKGIETLSNGVVGTPIVLAGAYFGYQGIVTGSVGDYSDKKTTYDKMLGDQDYAVNTKKLGELFNVNIGDTTITMDWLSPYSMPFFVGTELGTALSNQEGLEGLTATQLVDAMASITEPFLEMSMMQGVQDLITQSYDGNAVEVMATNQMKTYVTQFVPTLLSQIAKTVAEEKTTTKTVNDGTVAGKSFASTIAQLKSKVPGLYETNQPDVDVWGRTETKEDVWDYVRAGVRNILSPANVKDINITDVDKEILSVYDSIDDEKSSVIPTPATSSVEYKGTTYKMTDSQWTDFKKDIGSARYSGLEELFKTKKYKNSSPDIKAKLIKEVYSDALASAKKNFLISSGNMTEEEYNKSNITSKAATKLIGSGKTTATKVTKAKETLKSSGVSDKAILQAYVLYDKYDNNTIRAAGGYNSQGNYKISDNTLAEVKAAKKAGVSLTQLQKAYVKSDKDGNGSIKKDEATAYLNKTNYSQAQKRAIFDALMSNPETNNPY